MNALKEFKPTVEVLKETSSVGLDWMRGYTLMLLLACALVALTGAWAAQSLFGTPFFTALSVLALLVASLVLVFVLWSAGKVGDWLSGVIAEGLAWSEHARAKVVENVTTETTQPAYLPTEVVEPREIPVTTASREVVVTLDYVNGFHPKTLEYWSHYLANGNPTSETRLEKQPLPYGEGGVLFGGLTEGTPLTRLLDLSERRGILSARDSAKRKPGTLLIKEQGEILKLLLLEDENA